MLREWLINRAKRTPYFHLDIEGQRYMNRFWVVPYGQVIERRVPAPDLTEEFGIPSSRVFTDGTGPVSWRHPFTRLVQKLGIAARIHEILLSDAGRHPHDHPWWFLTIILKGGYFERRYDADGILLNEKWHGAGSVLFRRAGDYHRLIVPNGMSATTLFISGPKSQTWGFNVEGTKVPYWEYKDTQ